MRDIRESILQTLDLHGHCVTTESLGLSISTVGLQYILDCIASRFEEGFEFDYCDTDERDDVLFHLHFTRRRDNNPDDYWNYD